MSCLAVVLCCMHVEDNSLVVIIIGMVNIGNHVFAIHNSGKYM